MAFTRASGKKLHLRKEGCNYQDSAMPFILGSESSFAMLSTYQFKKEFSGFWAAYSRSRSIWDWLSFSCGVAHCGEGLISLFQGLFASIGGIFIWRGYWVLGCDLLGLGTLLIFPNFLRS